MSSQGNQNMKKKNAWRWWAKALGEKASKCDSVGRHGQRTGRDAGDKHEKQGANNKRRSKQGHAPSKGNTEESK